MDKSMIRIHNGRELYPVKIDLVTWVLVPKDKATKEFAVKFKEKMAESRKLAINGNYNGKCED